MLKKTKNGIRWERVTSPCQPTQRPSSKPLGSRTALTKTQAKFLARIKHQAKDMKKKFGFPEPKFLKEI